MASISGAKKEDFASCIAIDCSDHFRALVKQALNSLLDFSDLCDFVEVRYITVEYMYICRKYICRVYPKLHKT